MTFHRFIYKVVWKKKVIVSLVFLCSVLAIVTTFFHHSLLPPLRRHKKSFGSPPQNNGYRPNNNANNNDADDEKNNELGANEIHGLGLRHVGGGAWNDGGDGKVMMKGYVEDARKKVLHMLQEQDGGKGIEIDRDVAPPKFQGQERKAKRPKVKFVPFHNTKLLYNPQEPPIHFQYWRESHERLCENKVHGYFNEFAQLENVIFDRNFCHGRKGGENIQDVLLQAEEAEFYSYDLGCMRMECSERPDYFFNNQNHLNDLLFSLKTKHVKDSDVQEKIVEGFHLLVTRYEYANIYHTMTDWYNAFLLMNYFNRTQAETNILVVDGHPKGQLDSVWQVLFNSTRRLSDLKPVTLYKELTFSILGYNSHFLDHTSDTIPLIEEFSRFFMDSYRIPYNEKKLDCDKVSVLFIWRRDYLAHPRNPTGQVSRKIANERELIDHVQKQYPDFHVKGLQIDLFDMQHQLQYASEADILIGMHGAGLTHGLFLPKHGGLIELIPNYWSAAMEHFMAIARWKELKYERWVNTDPHNEAPSQHTTIPPHVLNVLLRSLLRQMGCLPALNDDDM